MGLRRIGRIQLSDDPAFTRKSWLVERAGWVGLAAFLAASFLGLLGPGLFSEVAAGDSGLRATYDRFGHFHSEGTLRFQLERTGSGAGSIWIDDGYLNGVEIESIRPEPAAVRAEAGGSLFTFATGDGAGPVEVRFEVKYRKAGSLRGRIGLSRERALEIRQFVYP